MHEKEPKLAELGVDFYESYTKSEIFFTLRPREVKKVLNG